MTQQSPGRFVALGFVVLLAAAAIGIGAYNAGVAHGVAESARFVSTAPPGAPVVYGLRPWGFGFFPVFPFFFFLFFLLALRGFFWRGPWGAGFAHRHPAWAASRCGDVPPMFEEWHRRAHERAEVKPPAGGSAT